MSERDEFVPNANSGRATTIQIERTADSPGTPCIERLRVEQPQTPAEAGLRPRYAIDEAEWLWHPMSAPGKPVFLEFGLDFHSDTGGFEFEVTADQRFELYLDGVLLARGPDSGERDHWSFARYRVDSESGAHRLVARVWWLGECGPHARMTAKGGFVLAGLGGASEMLTTGSAPWKVRQLLSHSTLPQPDIEGRFIGDSLVVDAKVDDGPWVVPNGVSGKKARPGFGTYTTGWSLFPADMPDQRIDNFSGGRIRSVVTSVAREFHEWREKIDCPRAASWQNLIETDSPVTLSPNESLSVLWDFDSYLCGYPEIEVSGGTGARIRWDWAESLYEEPEGKTKGNRGAVDGKFFRGFGDEFCPAGDQRIFRGHWWHAGRYALLTIQTGDAPLTVHGVRVGRTGYPLEVTGRFSCDDPSLDEITTICTNGLIHSSHETFVDCPYYEQLMYAGDARIEALVSYVLSRDDRLARRSMELFDFSRKSDGFCSARFPSRTFVVIGPFCFTWIWMLHDYLFWRNDPEWLKLRLPGMRAVLEATLPYRNEDGLIEGLIGWNFVDWAPGWRRGVPPGGNDVSAIINLMLVLTLRKAAEIEAAVGDSWQARRWTAEAGALSKSIVGAFWNRERRLFRDCAGEDSFSQHTQILAILADVLNDNADGNARLLQALTSDSSLTPATIYFRHYLFEAFGKLGRGDSILSGLDLWRELGDNGLLTTIEHNEPTRSDCHGWGSHPLYHLVCGVLGARPISPGFQSLRIAPSLGELQELTAEVPHPKGKLLFQSTRHDKAAEVEISLPEGITGELIFRREHHPLREGTQKIFFEL